MKVNYNKTSSIQIVEENLFAKILEDYINNLSPEDMKKFSSQLDIILNGIDDYQGKKKLVTACLAYIKDKQEEVA
ncbi:hypothetical protein [Helicobacter winghamensis]|uniref:hypothetical protein n=1 Tax=Helicobacter winghamensis TaxID=157268 RepID=UPI00242CD0B5|nr:hypothetical protein [Helicobacter winghamensis]